MSNLSGNSAVNILTGLIQQFNNIKTEIDMICKDVALNGQNDYTAGSMKKGVDFCILCLKEKLQKCKDLMEER